MPGMPDAAVGMLDVQINRDLANVMQQRRIGGARGPGLGLGRLCFRRDASGKQIGLPQLEGVGHDFETVIQHTARIGVVVAFGSGELLHQLRVAFQRSEVERGELSARQRSALPDVFQQLLPARRSQQRCGRLRPHQPFRHFDGGCGWRAGDGRHPVALEQREEHDEPPMMGLVREPFGLFG
ncbi:hypothetical protein D3C76_784560 [compost metagenome]